MSFTLSPYTMMALGPCRFSIDTFAHDNLVRTRSWKWAADDVVGAYPTLQYTGPQAETIVLDGWTYPGFKIAGYLLLEAMAILAGRGKPLLMISGYGLVFGFWVIESITQTESTHNVLGMPRKINFKIALKRYTDLSGAIAMLLDDPLSAIGTDTKELTSALSSIGL
ncbi:MAG: phage tail protein [Chthoniobacteraceae bacterium]